MIILIDNYDSFVYNMAHALEALGAATTVLRNDALSLDELAAHAPRAIVISSGSGLPAQAGITIELIKRWSGRCPILGISLGHLAIGAAFGAELCPATRVMHGKTSLIHHRGVGLYQGLKNPFSAGCYHALALHHDNLPATLVIEATADDGEIMGLRHSQHPTYGLGFHPESVLTPSGKRLFKNFLDLITPLPLGQS